ncbi:MAG TPA: TonB-dependent receptor [Gemmatimonadaceae bacterium]
MTRLRYFVTIAVFTAPSIDAQAAPPKDTTIQLERVTVTATRSTQPAFLVPLAVTRIEKDELQGSSGIGLDQALKFVPGVLAQSRSGGTDIRLVIRGYGARGAGDRSNSGTSRGIRIMVDGFPETEPDGRTSFDAIDLSLADRMDVVRSNASALWGNASGGLVSVSTIPSFTNSRAYVEPMSGTFGMKRIVTSLGGRVGEVGKAWVDHTNTTQDGWRQNSSGRRQLLNAGVTTPVGSRTMVTVHATAANNLVHVPGPLTWDQYVQNPQQANPAYLTQRERRHNRTGRLGVNLEHERTEDTGFDVSVFVNPKYLQRSERNSFRDFTRYHFGSSALAHTKHALGGRQATLMAGGDAAYQSGAILFYNLVNGERGTTLNDNKSEGARNVGFFVQDELPITSRLSATLGARYDEIAYDYRSYINPALNAKKNFDGVTPKLGFSFLLGPSHVIYGNVGGGVEVPAGNETDPTPLTATPTALNPLLEPIRSTTYELGTRRGGTFRSDLEWSYDFALYNTEVKNEIIPYRGGRFYASVGRARRQGVELGLSLESGMGLGTHSALTFNRHRYVDYIVDSALTAPATTGKADYSGNKVVGVPDVMIGAEVFYQPKPIPWLRLELGARQNGSYFADDANNVTVPSQTVFDGGISVASVMSNGASLRARIAVDNLTDKRYVASAFLNPDRNAAGLPIAYEPGLPRTLVFSLSMTHAR